MAITTFHPELAGARDCPFCGGDLLFFEAGSVSCDRCQASGPFIGRHFASCTSEDELGEMYLEAVRKWNLTPGDDWDEEE